MLYWVLIATSVLNGFEDGRFVGDATVPLTKARSCADAERAGALYEFVLSLGLRADKSLNWITCSLQRKRRFWMFGSTHRWRVAAIIWQWLARIRQFATLVFLGTGKKKRIPCALRWTANDPVAWEKAVGGSG